MSNNRRYLPLQPGTTDDSSRAHRRVRLMLQDTQQAQIETDKALRSSCERLARQGRPVDREQHDEPGHDGA
jgi:hypothetical protein